MSNWHYSQNGKQQGPISFEQLRDLVMNNRIAANELIWTPGMLEWQPLANLREKLFPSATREPVLAPPVSAAPDAGARAPAAPVAQPIAYFNPTAGLQERVARNLRGFPPPTGSQGEFPLSEMQLQDLQMAEKSRKLIRSMANTFRALGALSAIAFLILGMLTLVAPGPGGRFVFGAWVLVYTIIVGSLTVAYFLAASATLRCRLWGAIAVLCLMCVGLLGNVVLIGSTLTANSRDAAAIIATSLVSSIIPIAILIGCIRVIFAIRRFLAAPVWCQEALVVCKL